MVTVMMPLLPGLMAWVCLHQWNIKIIWEAVTRQALKQGKKPYGVR